MRRSALAAPYLLGLATLVGLPALAAAVFAFTEFSGVAAPRFTGFDNLGRLLGDDAFLRALGNSLFYAAISVPLRVGAAVGLALMMYRRAPGIGAARSIVVLPTVVPDAAFALLGLWLLNPLYGPLATGLVALGFDPPGFLTEPWATRLAIPVLGAFQIGEGFVVALAARRAIPQQLYEAARVDGARSAFVLRKLTLPLMAPMIALLALRDVILAFQVNFVPALLITEGGPRYATTYLPLYLYRQAFSYFRLGYASTIALTMFVLTALIVYVQYRLARRWRML